MAQVGGVVDGCIPCPYLMLVALVAEMKPWEDAADWATAWEAKE